MDQQLLSQIRRCLVENLSQREVARRLMIDRGTVRRALKREGFAQRRVKRVRGSRLDPHKGQIKELIQQYPNLSCVRVFQEIGRAGYSGGLTLVKDYLRRLRPSKKEAFLRIETLPGEQAQVDWADCGKMMIEGSWRRLSCFVMVLSYSRMLYLEFTLSQKIDAFIQAHINAFRFFGGLPKKILYDNLKAVVLWRMEREIGFNPRFMDFVGHYLFEPRLCRPYRGSDKGKVESGIKYVKGNFLAGRDFNNLEDLEFQGIDWRDNTANVRIHGTTRKRSIDRFKDERSKLMPLPERDYDPTTPVPVKCSSDCRIKFDSNIYSVPSRFVAKVLTVKATKNEVFIYYKDRLIARHRRSWGKYRIIEDPRHLCKLLERKKRASSKVRDEFMTLGNEAREYLEGLIKRDCNLSKELPAILKLRHLYGVTEVLSAISWALRYEAFGASYIENIIIANRQKRGEEILHKEITLPYNLVNTEIEERHPSIYDILLMEKEEDGKS